MAVCAVFKGRPSTGMFDEFSALMCLFCFISWVSILPDSRALSDSDATAALFPSTPDGSFTARLFPNGNEISTSNMEAEPTFSGASDADCLAALFKGARPSLMVQFEVPNVDAKAEPENLSSEHSGPQPVVERSFLFVKALSEEDCAVIPGP